MTIYTMYVLHHRLLHIDKDQKSTSQNIMGGRFSLLFPFCLVAILFTATRVAGTRQLNFKSGYSSCLFRLGISSLQFRSIVDYILSLVKMYD
jgi:hypothetical protein